MGSEGARGGAENEDGVGGMPVSDLESICVGWQTQPWRSVLGGMNRGRVADQRQTPDGPYLYQSHPTLNFV